VSLDHLNFEIIPAQQDFPAVQIVKIEPRLITIEIVNFGLKWLRDIVMDYNLAIAISTKLNPCKIALRFEFAAGSGDPAERELQSAFLDIHLQ
jgi:hypothetical protein